MIMETFATFLTFIIYFITTLDGYSAASADPNEDQLQLMPLVLAKSYLEGSDVNIYCVVASGDRRSIIHEWRKNNVKLQSGSNLRIENQGSDSVLKLSNIDLKDAGQYTCAVRNGKGQDSKSATLVINVPMKWTEEPQDVIIGVGKQLVMRCSVRGQPKPDIKWFKRGGSTSQAVANFDVTFSNQSNKSIKDYMIVQQEDLVFNSATINDSGLYECVASNGVDSDLRKVVEVKIQGKF